MQTPRTNTALVLLLSCGLGTSCTQNTATQQETPLSTAGGTAATEGLDDGASGVLECRSVEAGLEKVDSAPPGERGPDDDLVTSGATSEQANPNGGATGSYKTCSDMYFTCQEKGRSCTKKYPGCATWGQSECGTCYQNCQTGTTYPRACKCSACGFTE